MEDRPIEEMTPEELRNEVRYLRHVKRNLETQNTMLATNVISNDSKLLKANAEIARLQKEKEK